MWERKTSFRLCLSCLSVCPIQTPYRYKPHALPRQPVVFYDETRWDLERDLRRDGKRDGFFLPWHPSRGTTTSDFHFRGKTQGSLSYGHDNKRCFTAHNAYCLSILLHLLWWFFLCLSGWRVWSSVAVECLVSLPILFILSQFVFQFSLCYFVPLCLCLSETEEVQNCSTALPSITLPNNACSIQSQANVTHSYDLSICCFEQPSPSFVMSRRTSYWVYPFVSQNCLYICGVIKCLCW